MSADGTAASRGLSGRGLQQSPTQWARRGDILVDCLTELATTYGPAVVATGLDVGCQEGALTDALGQRLGGTWHGIDPGVDHAVTSLGGCNLLHGWAHDLPFEPMTFDIVTFANVFEHVDPMERSNSLREMSRVLRPGGVIVGQIPNPYFFIESHSRLPFMGYLPIAAQKRYWRFAPVPWEHDFYVATLRTVRRHAQRVGLQIAATRKFNYPIEVVPAALQSAARMLGPVTKRVPWAWQFVLRRPESTAPG